MIKVNIHDQTTWKPPICCECDKPVGMTYFIKQIGAVCHQCEGKLRKAKRKKRKK